MANERDRPKKEDPHRKEILRAIKEKPRRERPKVNKMTERENLL